MIPGPGVSGMSVLYRKAYYCMSRRLYGIPSMRSSSTCVRRRRRTSTRGREHTVLTITIENHEYEESRELIEANWRGTGGEPESKYLYWDHDYRAMTKQTSMIFFDTTDGEIEDDYWASMRLL